MHFLPFLRTLLALCAAMLPAKFVAAQAGDLVITHVTIINPGQNRPQEDMTIVVRGNQIVSVGPSKRLWISGSSKAINGEGKFVIPGLWDMHSHFRDAQRDLNMDIANGVLGTRNMGGAAKDVFPPRDEIARGKRLGPKLVACGPILDGPNSFSNPQFTISVKNADEARAAVESLKREGSDCVKVYDGLSRESYFAILDQAKQLGLPVVGHVPRGISAEEASNVGQRSLEHGVELSAGSNQESEFLKRSLDLSAFDEALRTKNFPLIPAKIARDNTLMLDTFSQSRADAAYKLLAKNNTFVTPTMVTQHSLTFVDDLSKENDPRMQYVSAGELQGWKPENGLLSRYRTPEYIAMKKREYKKMMEELPRAQSLGVRLLAGTDTTIPFTYPGFSLHDELKIFVDAGLTPMQALKTATTNPALLLGLSKTWGRIESGYSANFVLLTANPLADISNTTKIDSVIVNGQFLDRARLDQMLLSARVSSRGSLGEQ